MATPERIAEFLKQHSGKSYCDDCLAKSLGVPFHEVTKAASALALETKGFVRGSEMCTNPHSDKRNVTRFA